MESVVPNGCGLLQFYYPILWCVIFLCYDRYLYFFAIITLKLLGRGSARLHITRGERANLIQISKRFETTREIIQLRHTTKFPWKTHGKSSPKRCRFRNCPIQGCWNLSPILGIGFFLICPEKYGHIPIPIRFQARGHPKSVKDHGKPPPSPEGLAEAARERRQGRPVRETQKKKHTDH